MPNNNAEYWANRFAMLKDAQYKKADEYVKELEKVYRQIRSDLEKDLAKWYNRLAENNEVSLAEAKRMLDNEELEEFKWTVEQYIERASDAGLARKYMKELENASARVHIRRLEAMELQIEYYVALLMNSEEKGINELLSGLYSDTYYQAIYEMQKGSGIGAEFTALNTQAIENIMLKPWADDGLSFGKRIQERYSPELVNRLSKTLSRSLISGDSQRKLARSLEKDFDLAEGQAERLIQTESAFFIEAATLKSYEETGVDEYKILATLDYRTSEICRSMDGKVFSRKDAVTGVNYPPFHCRCRTTTVPLTGYEDMFEPGERVARNADGDIYYVPEDMTYPEWYKKYVDEPKEERYNEFKKKTRDTITSEYAHKINQGQQDKHIIGTNNYIEGRSVLTADPEYLMNLYIEKALPIRSRKGLWSEKSRFTHDEYIGYIFDKNGNKVLTKNGIIHYSKKKGVHIVPAKPEGVYKDDNK